VSAIVGTNAGVYRLRERRLEPLGLADQEISAVHAWHNPAGTLLLLAGSYGNGLFRSDDGGATWTMVNAGLTATAFRTIVPDPHTPEAILCGTEPARLFRSHDDGLSWHELDGIRALAGCDDWYLPYSPRAGALRNVFAPPDGNRLLAAIEVGGLIDSRDDGATWSYLPVPGGPDLHHITGHPDDPGLLVASVGWAGLKGEKRAPDAPTLGGVALSRDGGQSWERFHSDYTRATVIPPSRPDLLLAAPAKRVGAQGRIEVSADQGASWQPAGDGIEQPMTDMVERFVAAPDESIWAICSGGRLFSAEPDIWHWRSLLPDDTSIEVQAVAFLPKS
jgi:photosystem II stability/assembly factor-like uncharacterized protein